MKVLEPIGLKRQLRSLVRQRDPLVINADLLDVLEVVEDDHLLASDDRHAAHLAWIQPAQVYVRENVVGEACLDERHIVYTGLNVGRSACTNRDRIALQDVE